MWHFRPMSLLLAPLCILTACAGSDPLTSPPRPIVTPDIYVAGYELNGSGVKVAMVWKDGVGKTLSDGSLGAYATGIAVVDKNVYVSGVQSTGPETLAMLWTNGVATPLSDGTLAGYATSVTVSGSDVYVSGGEVGFDSANNFANKAGYWKNGVFQTVIKADSNGQNGAQVSSIAVVGTDVYLAGTRSKTTYTSPSTAVVNSVAEYWKNGQETPLTDGLTPSSVTSLLIVGSDVYVAGATCITGGNPCLNASYWKNGIRTTLSATAGSILSGVAISPTGIVVSGNEPYANSVKAEYWSNGQLDSLLEVGNDAANGVSVSATDVYVVGANSGSACYWKNGNPQPVADGGNLSSGLAIAVVQPGSQ